MLTFKIIVCIISFVSKTGCGSVWLERHLREVEAASSNLVTPTNLTESNTAESKGSAVFLRFGVSTK